MDRLRRLSPSSVEYGKVVAQAFPVSVVAVFAVRNDMLQQRYDRAVAEAQASGSYQHTADTFHGTTASHHIVREGFKVGGVSVGVRHGQKHGIGVYSSLNANFARNFAGPAGKLIQCEVCVTRSVSIVLNHIHLQPNPNLIIPKYVIEYD